ncbi:MAG: fumarylacetoacetate hydrolase family protein, partial [Pseudonocardiales bacterium]|nr:fumarylacetoacetate hydrolase family protein [Pseudonocardiales bacterium]
MSTSVLRSADAWWVPTPAGATRIATEAQTTAELLADRAAIAAAGASGETVPLESLALVSPVTAPCRVVAQATNFASHVKDVGMNPEQIPLTFFRKASGSIAGPYDDVIRPAHVRLLDYEVEIGLVIGREMPVGTMITGLADALNRSRTVTLFCGAGVAGAHDKVMALAARVHSPIGHTLRGKEWIQYDNPYDVGMSGLLGYGACYEACHEADLLLMLGTDFPYEVFLPQSHTIQVDRDATRLGRRTSLELAVHGDVGATLRAVLPLVEQKSDCAFLDRMLGHHASKLEHVVNAYTQDTEDHVPIHPEHAARVLDELAADDAIFTVDTGMCNVWAARYLTPNGRRRVIGSFS